MQSISKIGRGHLGYYLDLAREDYQTEGGEKLGVWMGRGAASLGLNGPVTRDALYNLFDGYCPSGRLRLTQAQSRQDRPDHQSGWDLTFSAPKSVSILWSQGSQETKQAIEAAHNTAVVDAMAYLEDEVAFTRRGRGGIKLEHSNVVAAAFEHGTSRSGDPNLHTHVLVVNVGVREDGTTGTLHSPNLYHAKMASGALYQNSLASAIQELGVEIERDRFSFRIVDVPKGLEAVQSKRRSAIEKALHETPGPRESAAAALRTREEKEVVPREVLDARWRAEARSFGFGKREADRAINYGVDRRVRNEASLRQAMDESLKEAIATGHDFNQQEFLRASAQRTVGLGYSAKEVRTASRNFLESNSSIEPQR